MARTPKPKTGKKVTRRRNRVTRSKNDMVRTPKPKTEEKVTRYTYDEIKEPRTPETGHTSLLPADEQVIGGRIALRGIHEDRAIGEEDGSAAVEHAGDARLIRIDGHHVGRDPELGDFLVEPALAPGAGDGGEGLLVEDARG